MNPPVNSPVNAAFRTVIEALPPFDLTDVPELRRVLGLTRPGNVAPEDPRVEISEFAVAGRDGGPDVRVRVYRPSAAPRPAPGLLFVHGGGFVLGNLDSDAARCLRFCAEAQYVVVALDYRLAPEHPFPAPFEDCRTVLQWMWDGADELGLDRGGLAVGGSSAGGALAAALTLWARDTTGPRLAGQVLVYPVTDDRLEGASVREFWDVPGWNGRATSLMWKHYLAGLGRVGATYAVPARAASLSGLPPAFIVVAGRDPLRDEGLRYGDLLRGAGVPTQVREFPDVPHGFDQFVPDAPESRQALAEQVTFLRRCAAGAVPGAEPRTSHGRDRARDAV